MAPKSGLVQCRIIRETLDPVTASNCPRYNLQFQLGNVYTLALVAIKQQGNITSNYHIFDTARLGGRSYVPSMKLR